MLVKRQNTTLLPETATTMLLLQAKKMGVSLYRILRLQETFIVILTTMLQAIFGLLCASFIGISFGCLAGISLKFRACSSSWINILTTTPPIAWIVLSVIWFGGLDL